MQRHVAVFDEGADEVMARCAHTRASILGRLSAVAVTIASSAVIASPATAATATTFVPATGSPVASGAGPYSVAFASTNALLASANYLAQNVSVYSVNASTGVLKAVPGSPFATGRGPAAVALSPSGTLLATANLIDGTVSVFSVDASTGALTEVAGSPFSVGNEPYSIAFNAEGSLLAVANLADETISVLSVNAATGALTPVSRSPFPVGSAPRSVAFSPTGGLLATANDDGTVSMFSVDPATGALAQIADSPVTTGAEPRSVAFSPSGGLLATANLGDNTVSMFSVDPSTGALSQIAGSPFATGVAPYSVTFSPDGGLLATANYVSGDVSVFSVSGSGAPAGVIGSPFAAGVHPHSVAFGPGGRQLAVANAGDGTVSEFALNLPIPTITSPASGGTYAVGQRVTVVYRCVDSPYGPGIGVCTDSVGGSSRLDTSTPGLHTFTVTATSTDGLTNDTSITYTVLLEPPTNITPPVAHGPVRIGGVLRCSPGAWTGAPTYAYQWLRSSDPIPGARRSSYRIAAGDPGASLSCAVGASNAVGVAPAVDSNSVAVPRPGVPGCPAPSGAVQGRRLGLIRLGMTRERARRTYRSSTLRHTAYVDYFCVAPIGIRVGYPTPRLLKAIPGGQSGLRSRVVWVLTANRFYTVDGVAPGTTKRAADRLLAYATGVTAGSDHWYFVADGLATAVVDVRGASVRQVGIVVDQAIATPSALRALIDSFGSGRP
jgi:6-phosphogluconolactonase (cycloisomerase 2 family)